MSSTLEDGAAIVCDGGHNDARETASPQWQTLPGCGGADSRWSRCGSYPAGDLRSPAAGRWFGQKRKTVMAITVFQTGRNKHS